MSTEFVTSPTYAETVAEARQPGGLDLPGYPLILPPSREDQARGALNLVPMIVSGPPIRMSTVSTPVVVGPRIRVVDDTPPSSEPFSEPSAFVATVQKEQCDSSISSSGATDDEFEEVEFSIFM